ncbi:MAG: glycosyltransferase family 9 protein [Nanoarchaeota archaeon]|nr:glycosyltransferase family 9 protein [Nanoarchaeota archaeon]
MEILIIKLGAKGDVLRTLPVLIALKKKYPDSNITWITKRESEEIVKNSPFVKRVIISPFVPTEEYDLLYNFDIEEEATKIAMHTKANKKYGFYSDNGYLSSYNLSSEYYLNTIFDDELKKNNKKTYQEMIFESAEIDYKKQHHPIFLSESDKELGRNFLKKNNIINKVIGIHMGASSRWPSKVWHEEKVKEFIKKSKENNYEIVLFGGPNEIEKHDGLIKNLEKENIYVYRNNPNNTDTEFASLVNICDYMVCSDSFSLHVSIALKKSTIGLFFCTPPNEVEDYGILKKINSPLLYEFFPEKCDQYSEELTKTISPEKVFLSIKEFENEIRVVNAIIKYNQNILIIKRKEGIHKGKWAFPGGITERYETTGEALERELKEEVNLNLKKIIKKISEFEYPRENNKITKGECYLVETEDILVKKNEEIEDFKWIGINDIEKFNLIEGLDEEISDCFK